MPLIIAVSLKQVIFIPPYLLRGNKTPLATDEQDNMSETAVAASHRCSHFKVKCVESHLTNEANFEAKTVTT